MLHSKNCSLGKQRVESAKVVLFIIGKREYFVAVYFNEEGDKVAVLIEEVVSAHGFGRYQAAVTPPCLTPNNMRDMRRELEQRWSATLQEYKLLA